MGAHAPHLPVAPSVMVSRSHASGTDLRNRTGGSRGQSQSGSGHFLGAGPCRAVLERETLAER
jgi:hypothetical protein